MDVLAIDVGGTHIKFRTQRKSTVVKVDSGPRMTPAKMMSSIAELTQGWEYDCVSLGYPGPVADDRPLREPHNLGAGWVKFKYQEAFAGKPVRILNDAAMQALGSYKGGQMLFLGLGTGLGSAMIVEGNVQGMELAHLTWKHDKSFEYFLGAAGLMRDRHKKWQKHLTCAIEELRNAFLCDYIVLGGGNAKLVRDMPKYVSIGDNSNAFKGAFLLWWNGMEEHCLRHGSKIPSKARATSL